MLHARHRLKVDNYVMMRRAKLLYHCIFSSLSLGKELIMHVIIVLSHYDMFHMIVIHK